MSDRTDRPGSSAGQNSTQLPTTQSELPAAEAGQSIGPYRLLQKVGEGGMGEVYEAEQTEPVRRRVALKVIKHGMDTKQVVARFEVERQALAIMDHPAVAKVFDAGATPRGRPYFVMEFVQGVSITEHCDRFKLTTRERLQLFQQVCEGVQHAHHNAIIHRDLKPSNILVSIRDGQAVPKIIDFGVAKATSQNLTERTLFTELGVMIGTPEYMSPEQAEMTGQNIDTRTDVYSLGVLLYELLVGTLPVNPKEMRKAGFDEIRRRIREDEPAKPSTRLKTLGDASTESAKRRRTDVATLRGQLSGDLDWVTMRALEKDRTRRYGSPSELAADIKRHLNHEPVLASPPSTTYRMRKFVRRHRLGVAAAGLIFLALVLGLSGATYGLIRATRAEALARHEATTAEQVSEFLVRLFEVSDPGEARGNTVTASEILEKGAERIDSELQDQPLVRARLLGTIGRVYQSLGMRTQAGPLLEQSLETSRRLLGEDHLQVADGLSHLGWLRQFEGRFVEAEQHHRRALAIRQGALGDSHVDTAWSLYHLGLLHAMQGKNQEAMGYYDRALPVFEDQADPDRLGVAWCLNDLASLHSSMGDLAQAAVLYERALEIKEALFGSDHPDVAMGIMNLGENQKLRRNFQRASELLERALEIQEKIYSPSHPRLANSLANLAQVKMLLGEEAEADLLHQRAAEIFEVTHGLDHPDYQLHQACWFGARGERDLALKHLRQALERGFSSAWSIHDPVFDSLREDPEFQAIVAEVEKRTGSG